MTRGDLRESLIIILTEGNAPHGTLEDFDLDGIMDACHKVTGSYSLNGIGDDRFWEIVRQHDRTQQDDYDDDDECPGHESLTGEHMGESAYCDGSCIKGRK